MSFQKLNTLGKRRKPFLFISDFSGKKIDVFEAHELEKFDIEFSINENYTRTQHEHLLQTKVVSFLEYEQKFLQVIEKIKAGETYVLNLTQPTKITTQLSLEEIYSLANAHYKLRYGSKFVCFSPEKFISIDANKINTYPMKGTIDSAIKDAEAKILANKKEMAEHIMIVDLLRNDLSIVASEVRVEKFRYISKIDAGEKELLQVSSHISGKLSENWHEQIGDILQALLPAGSISGAPKKSTLKIINEVEQYERGYFSGVFGYYNGKTLDSGVMIRFIEKNKDGYFYKSGGGITLDSDALCEYNELQDKIYLP
jgi:para-aminobenzoate synthetase component 1